MPFVRVWVPPTEPDLMLQWVSPPPEAMEDKKPLRRLRLCKPIGSHCPPPVHEPMRPLPGRQTLPGPSAPQAAIPRAAGIVLLPLRRRRLPWHKLWWMDEVWKPLEAKPPPWPVIGKGPWDGYRRKDGQSLQGPWKG